MDKMINKKDSTKVMSSSCKGFPQKTRWNMLKQRKTSAELMKICFNECQHLQEIQQVSESSERFPHIPQETSGHMKL